MASIASFENFHEKYSRTKFYNVTDWAQADKYLIGEYHGGKKSNPTNGEFISLLASKYFVIYFAEGVECMEEILDEQTIQTIMKTKGIASELRGNMRFFGWDAQKESAKAFELLHKLMFHYRLYAMDQGILNPIQKMVKEIDEMDTTSVLRSLKIVLPILEKKLPGVKKNNEEIEIIRHKLNSEILSTFPKRTERMITSLSRAHEITTLNPTETKMVWVCGKSHLTEQTDHDEVNLNSLRQELQKHKAVAMLPALIDATEEFSFDEQMELACEGKMAKDYRITQQNTENLAEEWEQTINLIKALLVSLES